MAPEKDAGGYEKDVGEHETRRRSVATSVNMNQNTGAK